MWVFCCFLCAKLHLFCKQNGSGTTPVQTLTIKCYRDRHGAATHVTPSWKPISEALYSYSIDSSTLYATKYVLCASTLVSLTHSTNTLHLCKYVLVELSLFNIENYLLQKFVQNWVGRKFQFIFPSTFVFNRTTRSPNLILSQWTFFLVRRSQINWMVYLAALKEPFKVILEIFISKGNWRSLTNFRIHVDTLLSLITAGQEITSMQVNDCGGEIYIETEYRYRVNWEIAGK